MEVLVNEWTPSSEGPGRECATIMIARTRSDCGGHIGNLGC
jgi:hypothetical protein